MPFRLGGLINTEAQRYRVLFPDCHLFLYCFFCMLRPLVFPPNFHSLHAPSFTYTCSILNMFHSLHTVIPNECEESVAAVRVHPPPERPFALPVKPVHLLSSRTQLWNLFPLALPFRQAFFLLRSARAERCPKISSMPKYSIFNDRSALAERKSKLPLRIMQVSIVGISIYNNVRTKSPFQKRKKKHVL